MSVQTVCLAVQIRKREEQNIHSYYVGMVNSDFCVSSSTYTKFVL